jgi:TonB family protein
MAGLRFSILAFALMLVAQSQLASGESAAAPAGGALRRAQPAWGSDPRKRCPELQNTSAEEGAVAIVQFLVGPTGVPTRASIRATSGSEGFDAAATSCVMKLHFLPATGMGDGAAIESWQQLALKWEGPPSAVQSPRCDSGATARGDAEQSSVVVAEAAAGGDRTREQTGPATARAGVCVCVDETGKVAQPPVLTKSSGIPGFDKAALELSAAAKYRPATAANGKPTSGCFHLKAGLDAK